VSVTEAGVHSKNLIRRCLDLERTADAPAGILARRATDQPANLVLGFRAADFALSGLPVVPENAILAKTGTWSRGPAGTFAASSGEYLGNGSFWAREPPDLSGTRAPQLG